MAGWKLRKDKTQTETADKPDAAVPLLEETLPAQTAPLKETIPEGPSRWEMPPDDWSFSNSAIIAAPVENISVEDEPVILAETQHEEIHSHPAPIELGGEPEENFSVQDFSLPAENDDEEEEAGLPHFDDDVLPVEAASPPEVPEIVQGFATMPAELDPLPLPTEIAPAPAASATPLFQTFPSAAPAAEPAPEEDQFTSTLRLDRAELAASYLPPTPTGLNVPLVAPFLVDVPEGETQETPHTLVVRMGRLSATFELTKEVTIIGRPDSNLHYYPDVEIEIDDAVSRRHAEILKRGADFYLADAGSTNGTLLNGETLPAHEERLLAHGDRIRVGERTEIIFE